LFVVCYLGNALLEDQIRFLESGVNEVLTKPINLTCLKSALQRYQQIPIETKTEMKTNSEMKTTNKN
jgi:DNA-binding response OmpR family regulator